MLYGIGDVKNVVSNSATISVAGGDDANSKIYMFNLQLGMTKVKITGVSIIGKTYLEQEESTSYDPSVYYSFPKSFPE